MSRFLEYTGDTFPNWLRLHAGRRPIVDVGCGEGFLVRDLRCLGDTRVLGIDIRHVVDEDVMPYAVIGDATDHFLTRNRGVLLVLARPCHGEWISKVIANAHSEVLYLGRASKFAHDVAVPDRYTVTPIEVPGLLPCADGEPVSAWSIQPPPIGIQEFWLVRDARSASQGWRLRSEALGPRAKPWKAGVSEGLGFWVNGMGAGSRVRPEDEILEGPIAVTEERELDWRKCTEVRELFEAAEVEAYPTGWLAPDGAFHACEWMKHDEFAYYCLGFEVRELGKLGWVRVRAPSRHGGGEHEAKTIWGIRDDDQDLTPAQTATLRRLRVKFGYPPDPYDVIDPTPRTARRRSGSILASGEGEDP